MRGATRAGMLSPQPDTGPVVPGERHKETAMIPMTQFNQRLAEHTTRIDRVNQQGWIWQEMRTAGDAPVLRTTTGIAPIRRRIGVSIIRVGEWLRGAPTGHVADRAVV
jgi:hypothetical protein